MIDWNALRDFRTVVQEGSITAAAAKLGVTQPTLSRRISDLEEQLGLKLLLRSTRALRLTEAGERILERAKTMDAEAGAIAKLAMGTASSLEGTVRISVTEGLGIIWIAGEFAKFRRIYPNINIELMIENSFVDLQDREADIAIRLARPTQASLIARKVADFRFGLYASTDYIEQRGMPRSANDLKNHHAVGLWGTTSTSLWLQEIFGETRIVFLSNTLLAVRTAVRAGVGIGPVFRFLGDQDPQLHRILPELPQIEKEIWLTCTEEVQGSARIRAVFDFLANLLRENKHMLYGSEQLTPTADDALL